MAEKDEKELEIDKATPELPDELLIEIFLRLPPRSLFLFRSVSKHWLALIQNPNFIRSHINHPIPNRNRNRNRNPLLIVRTVKSRSQSHRRKVVLTLLSDDETLAYSDDVALDLVSPSMASRGLCHGKGRLHLLNPSNGLFCITDTADVVLFNPATRQSRQLPRSPLSPRDKHWYRRNAVGYFDRVGFGFDPVSDDYKVVRFHYKEELDKYYTNVDGADDDYDDADLIHGFLRYDFTLDYFTLDDDADYPRDRQIKVEIFSLKSNSWRELDSVLPASYPSRIHSHSLYLNGAFHWLAGEDDEEICSVIVFDLYKEAFKHFRLPETYNTHDDDIQVYLSVWGEFLSLIVHRKRDYLKLNVKFEIWVMQRYGDCKSWRKLSNIRFNVGKDRPLSFGGMRELLVESEDGRLTSFDLITKKMKLFEVKGDRRSAHAFRYKDSLVSLY